MPARGAFLESVQRGGYVQPEDRNRRWCWNNRRETRISIGAPSIRVPGPRSRIFPRIFANRQRDRVRRIPPRDFASSLCNVFQRSTLRIIFVTLVTRTKEISVKRIPIFSKGKDVKRNPPSVWNFVNWSGTGFRGIPWHNYGKLIVGLARNNA